MFRAAASHLPQHATREDEVRCHNIHLSITIALLHTDSPLLVVLQEDSLLGHIHTRAGYHRIHRGEWGDESA